MKIEISDQTTKRIQDVLGTFDPTTINLILGRVAADEQLLLSLMADPPSEEDIHAVREGLDDVAAGRTQSFSEFDAELRRESGFSPRATH